MTSPIAIADTETADHVRGARRALAHRSAELLADLAAKVELVTELQLPLAAREQGRYALVDFCTHRVVRHLLAIDQVLYATAYGAAETRLLARALRAQHGLAADRIEDLRRASGSAQVAMAARALVGLLRTCHHVEQHFLVPALAALPGVDLPALVDDVDTLLAGGELDSPPVLDVRDVPKVRRHPRIFGIYARLMPGESFVLVNNHDPKPLRREFHDTYPGQFDWDYLEAGPRMWRVRISRLPVGEPASAGMAP